MKTGQGSLFVLDQTFDGKDNTDVPGDKKKIFFTSDFLFTLQYAGAYIRSLPITTFIQFSKVLRDKFRSVQS